MDMLCLHLCYLHLNIKHYRRPLGEPITIINITNFRFIINNNICNSSDISIITIVHSALGNFDARNVIRKVI